jgi:hypothetical protein
MSSKPPRVYRIVPQKYSGYAVGISADNFGPTLVTPFATEAEAETWIEEQQTAAVQSSES